MLISALLRMGRVNGVVVDNVPRMIEVFAACVGVGAQR